MPVSLIASVTAFYPDDGARAALQSREINTSGSTLIVIASSLYAFGLAATPTDTKGNNWTLMKSETAIAAPRATAVDLFYAVDPIVGTHHRFLRNSTGNMDALFMVFAFGGRRFRFDKSSSSHVLGGSSVHPGSLTPAEAEEFFVTAASSGDFHISLGVDSGFSIQEHAEFDDGSIAGKVHYGGAFAWKEQSGALAAEDPTWSISPSTNVPALLGCFKSAPLPTRASYGYQGSPGLSS